MKIFLIAIFLIFGIISSYALSFEMKDNLEVGISPFLGIAVGDFIEDYPLSFGINLFARGLFDLSLFENNSLFPEIRISYQRMAQATEEDRCLNLFNFIFNIFWDCKCLNIDLNWSIFRIAPYVGFDLSVINYSSDIANETGLDIGYVVGIDMVLKPNVFNNFFILISNSLRCI